MKKLVSLLGLKGAIIFILLILFADKLSMIHSMLACVCYFVGTILLVYYLEVFIKIIKEDIVKKISEEIMESRIINSKLNDSIINSINYNNNMCLTEIHNSVEANLQNLYNYTREIRNDLNNISGNISAIPDKVIGQIDEKIDENYQKTIRYFNDVGLHISNNINAIDANQKNNYKTLMKLMTSTCSDVDNNIKLLRDSLEENLKTMLTIRADAVNNKNDIIKSVNLHNDKKIDDNHQKITQEIRQANEFLQKSTINILAKINDNHQKMTQDLSEVKLHISNDINVIDENQRKNYNALIKSIANSFLGIDENLTLFRDCLEENLKTVLNMRDGMVNDKNDIIKAINIQDHYLEKIKNKFSDSIEQEIIEDKGSNAIVINTKKNGITIQSEMREDNKLAFMAGYDNGRTVFTKTFDREGNITSETLYGLDGQVKERRTYIPKNGNIRVDIEKF